MPFFFVTFNNSQNNRETYLSKEANQSQHFLFVDSDANELKYELKRLRSYEDDKIKFVTKVQVDESRVVGSGSSVKIAKQPIYSSNDGIIFLLILHWCPNNQKSPSKQRKGSFSSQRQLPSKVRFQITKIDEDHLLSIVYLLSQKIYIEQKHIDQFMKVISSKHEISTKHQNCITAIVMDSVHKRNMTSYQSTVDQSRYHYYYYQHPHTFQRGDRNGSLYLKNDSGHNRLSAVHSKNSSHYMQKQKSPKMSQRRSLDSRQIIGDSKSMSSQLIFNLAKTKRYFSSVQYIVTDGAVTTEMIVIHQTDSEHYNILGFKLDTIQQLCNQWPKHKQFPKLFNLNKDKILNQLIDQSASNYAVMLSMQIKQINNVKLQQIYHNIGEFNTKAMNQFLQSSLEFINQNDYQKYVKRLENQLLKLEAQLVNNYAQTKFQYGSRMLKSIEKKNYKHAKEQYTLMKVLGKQQINQIQVGYKIYKSFIQDVLDQGFKQFLTKKVYFKSRHSKNSQNYQEEELNFVENRIEICQEKKKMLDSAIQLQTKETDSLRMMLRLFEKDDRWSSNPSQRVDRISRK